MFHEYEDYVSVYGYNGKESSVIIPDTYNGKNVNIIEGFAFGEKKYLKTIILPKGLTSIGSSAFSNCRGLKCPLSLPGGLTSIGEGAFSSSSGFTLLVLPSRLSFIENSAFSSCSHLILVLCSGTRPPMIGKYILSKTHEDLQIQVTESAVRAYKSAWRIYESRISALP